MLVPETVDARVTGFSSNAERAAAISEDHKRFTAGLLAQYGVQIPSSGFPYWLFQTLSTTNDTILANDTGTAVKFDDPKVAEALQFWVDLGKAGTATLVLVAWAA